MIIPKPSDAIHLAWLYRLLSAISDNTFLVSQLRFKGGASAAMRGILDRFSIDLDFDLIDLSEIKAVRQNLEQIFRKLNLQIKDQSQKVPQYFLKYENKESKRNNLKLDITCLPIKNNDYEPVHYHEIDRIIYSQTTATMFANKLVTVIDRFNKHHSIAGRDIFDVHTYFIKGYAYKPEIIEERTGNSAQAFIKILIDFIKKHLTQTIIDQDLNALLPATHFQQIRKILKQEVLLFLTKIQN